MITVEVFIPPTIDVAVDLMVTSATGGVVAVNYSDGTSSPLGDISAPGAVNIPTHGIRNSDDSVHFDDEFDTNRVFPDVELKYQDDTPFKSIPAGTEDTIMNGKIQRRLTNDTTSYVDSLVPEGIYVIEKSPIVDGNDVEAGEHVWNKTLKIAAQIASIDELGEVITINPVVPVKSGTLFFPAIPDQKTQYDGKKDIGYHFAQGAYNYTPPAYPLRVMDLDRNHADWPFRLTENSIFGTTHRLVTDQGHPASDGKGGFVIGDFINGATPWYVIDLHTGKGRYIANIGSASWNTGCDYIETMVVGPYSGFRPMSFKEVLKSIDTRLSYYHSSNPFKRGVVSGVWETNFVSGETTQSWGTSGAWGISNFNEIKIYGKTAVSTMYAIRNHY